MKSNLKQKSAIQLASSTVSLPPNPYKMAMSLRNVGYDPYDAIMDLIDNSLDAEATQIDINVVGKTQANGKSRIDSIVITDNGCGMDGETLKQALRYGSDTPHDLDTDLGMFGMGLKMASTSMGTRFEILTNNGDGKISKGVFDFELFKDSETFEYQFEQFDDIPGCFDFPTGTKLSILNIDSIGVNCPKSFRNTLVKKIARTFRHLLHSGKNVIKVGSKVVRPVDPLYWDHKETIRYTDGWVPVAGFDSLEYRIASVRKVSDIEDGNRTNNQGVSWIRNNREISQNQTDPFWKKFPDYRGFLVEARYTGGEVDKEIKVNIQKRILIDSMSDSLVGVMFSEINPYLKQCFADYKKEQAEKKASEVGKVDEKLKKYGERMKKFSKSLHMPPKQKPSQVENNAKNKTNGQKNDKVKTNEDKIKAHRSSHLGRGFKFERSSWTKHGPLMDSRMEGNDIIIILNSDHPFVIKLEEGNEINLASATSILASIGLSKLMLPDDHNTTVAFDRFFDHFTKNCAELVNNIPTI